MTAPSVDFDLASNVLSIDGVRMSWEFFCELSKLQPGTWLRIEQSHVERKFAMRTVTDDVARTFNAIVGAG